RRSLSPAWTQPAETARPKSDDESVPWMATRLPPLQPAGRFGWIAESARMQQPYAVLYALPLSLSVTAKRPVGVGEPERPTPTLTRRRRSEEHTSELQSP